MPWDARFWRPIALKDGRTIATLAEARDLVLALADLHQRPPHWGDAAQLLLRAASSDSAMDDALVQMMRALKAEGLL
jgi:hypothetical protein